MQATRQLLKAWLLRAPRADTAVEGSVTATSTPAEALVRACLGVATH
jgi:hypothetical protein